MQTELDVEKEIEIGRRVKELMDYDDPLGIEVSVESPRDFEIQVYYDPNYSEPEETDVMAAFEAIMDMDDIYWETDYLEKGRYSLNARRMQSRRSRV